MRGPFGLRKFVILRHDFFRSDSKLICASVCLVLCVCRGSKYSEVVPDWLILNSDLYRTIHDCGPMRTQFDDVVVLVVVFFALFSRSIGFEIFGNLKDIPLI